MGNRTRKCSLFLMILFSFLIINGCAQKRINTLTNAETQILSRISSQEAYELIKKNLNNNNFIIIDVRTFKEYVTGHIERSKMIDFNSQTFKNELQNLDKDKTYLIYCRSGNRSGKALLLMKEMGFKRVYEINGGIIDWNNNKLPVVNE